ncbi:gem-associated protein 5 isoform X1 [Hydra vulgaris]|uniref:gem-associated protein 5 isoform X1 n=2 Tax=Hydra vulgaris TaxID=6087 RepID=UPI001F5F4A85|nr:gem-associated protein 5 isoform X1 [Hydra vulgaris]
MTSKSDNENWRKQESSNSFQFQEVSDNFPCIIPASPNWYCSNIMTCMNGYIAFGGKWAVYLLNLRKNPPVCEEYLFGSPGYSCKVTAVAFCQFDKNISLSVLPSHCAFGMEDGLVKLIICETKSMLKEHRKHQVKITAISWSPLDNNVIITGDEKGVMVIWNVEENCLNVWTPISNMISCLDMSPNLHNIAAIGYGNGNVCVCDIKKLQVMQVFKSHIDEVCTLSWCPKYFREKHCFVSGSKDFTMKVWDINTEKFLFSYTVPKNLPSKKKEESQKMKVTKYLSVLWLNDNQILSSHSSGKILCWDLESSSWRALEGGHNRLVYALKNDATTNQFVSFSIDRQLVIWSSRLMKPVHTIPTVGGFLYSLSSTPLDPHSIAFGCGDNMIRVWNTADSTQSYKCTTLWQGIKTKVLIIKYHPSKEGILAFGTEDGHVGCYNVLSKKYDIATSYHQKSVYCLAWGPNCISIDERINSLYTIGGEGTILMHKMGSFNIEAINISTLIKTENKLVSVPRRSEASWRSDFLFIAIGNEDGTIDILSTKMHCVCKVLVHKKMINTLAWHHSYSLDISGGNFLCWLASGSDDYNVCVTDVADVLNNNNNELVSVIKPTRQLSNQTGRITQVLWSPHTNGVLALASFDGSVQVWNILTGEGIAHYGGHIGRVYTVMWSYSDRDVLYSGGDDFTLQRWRISEQNFKTSSPAKKSKTRGKKNKNKIADLKTNKQSQIDSNTPNELPNNNKPVGGEQIEGTVSLSVNEFSVIDLGKGLVKDVDNKKKRMRSLLKKSSVADSKAKEAMQVDCIALAQYLKAENEEEDTGVLVCNITPGSEEHPNLGLYSTRKDAYKLLQTECEGHKKNNSIEQLIQLETWRNNISGLINDAAQNNSLNDVIVALSPLGGFDLWRACVLAYAEQLEKKRNFNSAALYFLAVGETQKAINVFKDNGLFKEAVALAKVRLSKNNPLIQELYLLWAQKLIEENNNENAAECFLAAGKINEAITVLAKKGDSSSLLTAIKVADIYDMKKCSAEYLYRCIDLLISEHKWDICGSLLNPITIVQVSHLRAVVSELLVDKLETCDLVIASFDNHDQHRYYTKQEYFSNSASFLENVLVVLETCYKSIFVHNHFASLNLTSLKHEKINNLLGKDPKEIIGIVADRVLSGILSLLEFDIENCFKVWLTAFNGLLSSGFNNSLIFLFETLFPKSQMSYIELKTKFGRALSSDYVENDCFTNFVAFKYVGYLYKAWWKRASRDICNVGDTDLFKNMLNNIVDDFNYNTLENNKITLNNNDFFYLIVFLKKILLSDDHIQYYNVIEQIDLVDREIIEHDIKHNLIAYTRKNNIHDTQNVKNAGRIVKELVDDMIELVIRQSSCDDSSQNANAILPEVNSNMQQRQSLVAEAEAFKICVKEYAFPHPRESVFVFEWLCRFEKDQCFKSLHEDILKWIFRYKITKSR